MNEDMQILIPASFLYFITTYEENSFVMFQESAMR